MEEKGKRIQEQQNKDGTVLITFTLVEYDHSFGTQQIHFTLYY